MCRILRLCFRLILSFKIYLSLLIFISTVILIAWVLLVNRQVLPPWRLKKVGYEESQALEGNRSDYIYVLLWNDADYAPFYFFTVEDVFNKNNCSFTNCIVTDNKNYFGDNLFRFHAIAFNGRRNLVPYLATPRWPHQKFIYYNTESSANELISHSKFDGFFNWTSAYKLDSDIPYPYILIRDESGTVVGPKEDMIWRENMTVDESLVGLWKKSKWKAAVAFLSNCGARSKRDILMVKLKKRLKARGYDLDIYGRCGNKKCEVGLPACDLLVENYYFYLAFENSIAEDYVTEKVLRALNHNAVPVVFGGANYSRFLPPNSYLNAREYSPDRLAEVMVELIKSPDKYIQYFSWKNYYTYQDPMETENVCALCAALNNKTKYQTASVYQDMRRWWNH